MVCIEVTSKTSRVLCNKDNLIPGECTSVNYCGGSRVHFIGDSLKTVTLVSLVSLNFELIRFVALSNVYWFHNLSSKEKTKFLNSERTSMSYLFLIIFFVDSFMLFWSQSVERRVNKLGSMGCGIKPKLYGFRNSSVLSQRFRLISKCRIL